MGKGSTGAPSWVVPSSKTIVERPSYDLALGAGAAVNGSALGAGVNGSPLDTGGAPEKGNAGAEDLPLFACVGASSLYAGALKGRAGLAVRPLFGCVGISSPRGGAAAVKGSAPSSCALRRAFAAKGSAGAAGRAPPTWVRTSSW